MGLVNSALHIGRSAVSSYQSALSVVGQNIANAADPDYTRQQAIFEPISVGALPEGLRPGGGVALDSLQRVINEALESRLRDAVGASEAAQAEAQLLAQVEGIFDELGETGVAARLNDLFRALQDVQNLPVNDALRGVAVDQAGSLAALIRSRFETVSGMIDGLNEEIEVAVTQANELAGAIAALNAEIVEAETGGHTASALRDSRDKKLRELSELMDVTVRHQEGGSVSVFVGTEALVQLGHTRGLTTSSVVVDGQPMTQVEFGDGTGQVQVEQGRIGGLLAFRDTGLGGLTSELDLFAAGLIEAFNRVHADGQGLQAFTSLNGTTALSAADVALDEAVAGQPVTPRSGSFLVTVSDAGSGETLESVIIEVSLEGNPDDTTLSSLAEQISAGVPGLSATVTPDNTLSLVADQGIAFTFGHDGSSARPDSSGVLAALGINTLFTGSGAADIAVNRQIATSPERFAVSGTPHDGDTGNLARLIDLQVEAQANLGGRSLLDFYNQFVIGISTSTAESRQREAVTGDLRSSLAAQSDSISGVNLDEESVNLIKYERAFQGAARFTSVVDQMITEMLNILR